MPKGKPYGYDGATKGHGSVGGAKSTGKVSVPTDGLDKMRSSIKSTHANHNSGVGRLQAYKGKKASGGY